MVKDHVQSYLEAIRDMLADQHFFRAQNHSYQLQHIEFIAGEKEGMLSDNGVRLKIARRNKSSFLNLFN